MASYTKLIGGLAVTLGTLVAAQHGLAASPPAHEVGVTIQAKLDVYQRIAGVAGQVCVRPDLFGVQRSVDGKLSGEIGLSKLLKALSDAKVAASVRAGYSDWRGVRQQDAAVALNASNACAERLFTLMVDRLSLTDIDTGKPVAGQRVQP